MSKKRFALSWVGVICALAGAEARAAGEVWIDQPSRIEGNACNPSSTRATLTQQGTAISLLFDQFVAEAGGSRDATDRKTCVLEIPIRVAPGFRVAISAVDYRGFLALPPRGYSQFATLFNLRGFTPIRIDRRMAANTARLDANFQYRNQLRREDVSSRWSACGGSTSLQITTSLIVVSNAQREQTLGGIDSADFSSGVDLQLLVQPCRGRIF